MRTGLTLIELIVVLVMIVLAAALVAPTLLPPRSSGSDLAAAVDLAKRAAVRRGEPVTLQVDAAGAWRADGGGAADARPIASGRLPATSAPFTLFISPLGTCGLDPRLPVALAVDPLTCEVRTP